ncbi:MAG: OmpH family outer membrane protein [Nitrosomonadales bacterium]|nr:OmpH family outer membrane protein [Nitrosomonadales bacterium]
MRSTFNILIAILFAASTAQAVAADFRVGVVDTERILRESAPAAKAEKKIEKEFATRDQELKKLMKQAKDIQSYLEKEGLTLPESEQRVKERELANINANLQRMQREFREDLNLRKNEELTVVLDLANKAIQSLAETEHYDLILQEAVYRNPKIDITDKVLKLLAADEKAAEDKAAKK